MPGEPPSATTQSSLPGIRISHNASELELSVTSECDAHGSSVERQKHERVGKFQLTGRRPQVPSGFLLLLGLARPHSRGPRRRLHVFRSSEQTRVVGLHTLVRARDTGKRAPPSYEISGQADLQGQPLQTRLATRGQSSRFTCQNGGSWLRQVFLEQGDYETRGEKRKIFQCYVRELANCHLRILLGHGFGSMYICDRGYGAQGQDDARKKNSCFVINKVASSSSAEYKLTKSFGARNFASCARIPISFIIKLASYPSENPGNARGGNSSFQVLVMNER